MIPDLSTYAVLEIPERPYQLVVSLTPSEDDGGPDCLEFRQIDLTTGGVMREWDDDIEVPQKFESVDLSAELCSCCPIMLDFALGNAGPDDGGGW